MEHLYEQVNRAFKSTSKILLGDEIGELKDFETYLKHYYPPKLKTKSFYTKKDVYLSGTSYKTSTPFISQEEIPLFERNLSSKPLSIDSIKDIDSLFQEAGERFAFCGNKIFGNTHFTSQSDTIFDSNYIFDCHDVIRCEYSAYSSNLRDGKYKFGVTYAGDSNFSIRGLGIGNSTRIFESRIIFHSSDIYFGFQLRNCHDCLFTLNQHSKRHMIGNVQLEKSSYLRLKKKLIEEIKEELKAGKHPDSIFDLIGGSNG